MSGDIQPRSGTKLRQQRKKSKNSGMMMPELDISGIKSQQQDKVLGNGSSNSDVKNFDGNTKSKLNKKVPSKKPKGSVGPKAAGKPPRQQFYYEDLSGDEDVYNYDIAAPSYSSGQSSSCISICFKSFVLVAIAASIGFGGLYFHNPTEFWTTMDQVEAYMKPLGANAMWPDFQGIQKNLNTENVQSVLKSSCEYWDAYIAKPFKEHVVTQVFDLTTQTMAFIMPDSFFTEKDQLLTEEVLVEEEDNDERLIESQQQQPLEPSFEVPEVVLPAEDLEDQLIQESENGSPSLPPPALDDVDDVDEAIEEPPTEPVMEVEKVANPEPTNSDVVSEPPQVVEVEPSTKPDDAKEDPIINEEPKDDIIEPEISQKNAYTVGNEKLK